jgi:hypothetical protein
MNDNFVTKDAPRRAIVWTLEVELEAEALAVVGDRGLQILHDEGRPDRREIPIRLVVLRAVRNRIGRIRAHERQPTFAKIVEPWFSVCDRATSGSIVQQRLESKQDGALHEHGVEMRDDRRQQHPKRATPGMRGGQCKDG